MLRDCDFDLIYVIESYCLRLARWFGRIVRAVFFKNVDMSKKTEKQALKRLERAKEEYADALREFQTEEEIRLALASEPVVDLRRVQIYSAYYNGMRKAFLMMAGEDSVLRQRYGRNKAESDIYRKAIFDLITENIRKTELFVSGADIGFCNHVKDKKGKLKKCEAYFFEEYTLRKKIEE